VTARAWLALFALRIRGPVVSTWTCDKCGAVNSDSVLTCYKCGA